MCEATAEDRAYRRFATATDILVIAEEQGLTMSI